MIKSRPETDQTARPGFKRVVLGGRAYPTPEQAIEKLRSILAADGITVADEDIWAVAELPRAMCPYAAYALIPE